MKTGTDSAPAAMNAATFGANMRPKIKSGGARTTIDRSRRTPRRNEPAGRRDIGLATDIEDVIQMSADQHESDGATRVAYILGVPLADDVVRQWPQMGEIVRTSRLVADVEGNFPELTLEVGRRLQFGDTVVVEWTCNYGDGRLYWNVTIGELDSGEAVRVTDYWGEPTDTPEWRRRHRPPRHAR